MNYFVYVLAEKGNKPTVVGLTNDLVKGVYDNMSKRERETGKKSKRLLHYEIYDDPVKAKTRKRQLEIALLMNNN
jgi:predicted GIY-YIG superfamily endonuclease